MRDRIAMALDRSARSFDVDGHLRVADCVLTAACVSPYYGREIPNAGELGLQPDRIYQLLRPVEELERASASLRGKPVLLRHVPVTAGEHPHDDVCGAVGGDVAFDGDVVRGSITVWTADAISGIESGDVRALSAGYRYRARMEPGVFDGTRFDGRMVGIEFNHLAIVPEGRVPGAVVGDAAIRQPLWVKSDMATDEDDIFGPLNRFHREKLDEADVPRADELVEDLAKMLNRTNAKPAMDAAALRARVAQGRIRTDAKGRAAFAARFPNANRLGGIR